MANELQMNAATGLNIYAVLLDEIGQVWNGAAFEAINGANWLNYDIAMAEAAAGIYLGNMPAIGAGGYAYISYERAGGIPAVTDTIIGTGYLTWDGTEPVDVTDIISDLSSISIIVSSIKGLLLKSPAILQYRYDEDITIKRTASAYFEIRLNVDLAGRTEIYFTVKKKGEVSTTPDSQSVMQITETGGLLYLDGGDAPDPLWASLTVLDVASGHIAIQIDAEATTEIDADKPYKFDVKVDTDVQVEGNFFVESAVTWST